MFLQAHNDGQVDSHLPSSLEVISPTVHTPVPSAAGTKTTTASSLDDEQSYSGVGVGEKRGRENDDATKDCISARDFLGSDVPLATTSQQPARKSRKIGQDCSSSTHIGTTKLSFTPIAINAPEATAVMGCEILGVADQVIMPITYTTYTYTSPPPALVSPDLFDDDPDL